ncbi:MAG: SIMPL domain-containing protein [Thermaerobacter sp.]|nr:SIMPL domain-containing protein [Thermaerobacter sp.]
MRNRLLLSGGVLVAVLGLVAAMNWVDGRTHASTQPPVTLVTVVGTSTASAIPTQAVLDLGVQTSASNAASALSQNSAISHTVISRLEQGGVTSQNIATNALNVYPQYASGSAQPTSYQVDNQLSVTVTNLASVGALLDQAVAAGANQVEGIDFTAQNQSSAYRTAYTDAIANASARALAIATALHESVLGVQSVDPSNGSGGTVFPIFAASSAAATPVMPGQQHTTVSVRVVFRIGA